MNTYYRNAVKKLAVVSSAAALLIAVHTAAAGEPLKQGGELPAVVKAGLADNVPGSAGKVILLDFWASWCGPCKKSFPVMEKIYQDYKDKGFVVVGVNVDEDAGKMKGFLETHKVSFPVFHDAGQKLVAAAGIKAMPTSVLLDVDGRIVAVHLGFKVESSEKELRKEIEEQLAQMEGKKK